MLTNKQINASYLPSIKNGVSSGTFGLRRVAVLMNIGAGFGNATTESGYPVEDVPNFTFAINTVRKVVLLRATDATYYGDEENVWSTTGDH